MERILKISIKMQTQKICRVLEKRPLGTFLHQIRAHVSLWVKTKRANHNSDVSEDENVDEILEKSHPRDDHYKVIPPSDR